ncbi:unnamed protein product [Prorocentrum cordatum]|uniref:Uncharacterized protein n=1 Tax=Prorocentrum cordatum TaxID=2364126 RepID=A0ABN9WY55_9DINO|nr:unnamed protein product [Polarella glacialis]
MVYIILGSMSSGDPLPPPALCFALLEEEVDVEAEEVDVEAEDEEDATQRGPVDDPAPARPRAGPPPSRQPSRAALGHVVRGGGCTWSRALVCVPTSTRKLDTRVTLMGAKKCASRLAASAGQLPSSKVAF